jgi:hypothetical protein
MYFLKWQAIYVKGNIEVRSRSHCWNKYYIFRDCVFVVLDIQLAVCMCGNVICGLSGSAVFFHFISQRARISEKKIRNKMFVLIFSTIFFLKHFSFQKELGEIRSKMFIGFQGKDLFFLPDFNKLKIFGTDFRILYWNIIFNI